jgi:photosystem II stability/assembly factor-like uncharacterized protein
VVTTIAVSPLDTRIIWAGTDDGYVWVSPDDGGSWIPVSPTASGQWVTRVATDPFDAQTAYVSLSGYITGGRLPHVFKTTNLGASWSDITANLPQAPINALVVDPAAPDRIFAGGDVGVFMTQNGGAPGSRLAPALPHVVVMELDPERGTRERSSRRRSAARCTLRSRQLVIGRHRRRRCSEQRRLRPRPTAAPTRRRPRSSSARPPTTT